METETEYDRRLAAICWLFAWYRAAAKARVFQKGEEILSVRDVEGVWHRHPDFKPGNIYGEW